MKYDNRKIGTIGEELALAYLLQKGLELTKKNFRTRFGEIDLIMRDKGITIFVEVKTKKGKNHGTPEEMFGPVKYERIKRMAAIYLNGADVPSRIDMVAVMLNEQNQPETIKHYENVTLP